MTSTIVYQLPEIIAKTTDTNRKTFSEINKTLRYKKIEGHALFMNLF